MAITGGFGVEYDLISGRSRRWYIDSDGVRQYLIGDRPLTSICAPCAASRGSYVPAGHMPTWSIQTCDACGQDVACTEPRDFRPRPDSRKPTED